MLTTTHVLLNRTQALLGRSRDESAHRQGVTTRSNAWARLLDSVLNREYFLYRSYFYYQTQGRAYVSATTASNDHITSRPNLWKVKDWQHLIPSWVNEELQKGQRDMRQVMRHKDGRLLRNIGGSFIYVHSRSYSLLFFECTSSALAHSTCKSFPVIPGASRYTAIPIV